MNTEQPKLDDELQIYCNIGLHGWSDLILVRKGMPQVFRVSHVFTDFPNEMLAICRAVLENTSLHVALCDEPGGVVFEVTPDEKQQHTALLNIYEVERPPHWFPDCDDGNVIFSTRLRRQRLIGMILAELWKTHMSLKQPSFQKGRDSFPHGELSELNSRWDKSNLGPSFLTK